MFKACVHPALFDIRKWQRCFFDREKARKGGKKEGLMTYCKPSIDKWNRVHGYRHLKGFSAFAVPLSREREKYIYLSVAAFTTCNDFVFRQTVLCNVSAIASLAMASYPCTRIASGTKRGIDRDGRVFEQM